MGSCWFEESKVEYIDDGSGENMRVYKLLIHLIEIIINIEHKEFL
jgi:hypothetical protein